jgi:hypothetical protein
VALAWSTSDTSVALVDSGGVIRPRRAGVVTVSVTSGGWVSDSLEVRFTATSSQDLVHESWQDGIEARWRAFGDPRPFLSPGPQERNVSLNGDSSFTSGIYLSEPLTVGRGLGVELVFSMKVTSRDWQLFEIAFISSDAADFTRWNHRTGEHPLLSNTAWTSCRLHYSTMRRVDRLPLLDGQFATGPAPAQLAAGERVRLRLQVLPDGRCGIGVNGRALIVGQRRVTFGRKVTLVIHGYSHRTSTLVGPVRIWQGVRGDVSWRTGR